VLIDQDRIPVRVLGDEAGGAGGFVGLLHQLRTLGLSWRCNSRTSVNAASFCALLSQPGLKVRMFPSNIP